MTNMVWIANLLEWYHFLLMSIIYVGKYIFILMVVNLIFLPQPALSSYQTTRLQEYHTCSPSRACLSVELFPNGRDASLEAVGSYTPKKMLRWWHYLFLLWYTSHYINLQDLYIYRYNPCVQKMNYYYLFSNAIPI